MYDKIDTTPTAPAIFGDYLVKTSGCRSCHGEQLNRFQSGEPSALFAPNITAGGAFGKWTETQFIQTLRAGITPDSRKLDLNFMPW